MAFCAAHGLSAANFEAVYVDAFFQTVKDYYSRVTLQNMLSHLRKVVEAIAASSDDSAALYLRQLQALKHYKIDPLCGGTNTRKRAGKRVDTATVWAAIHADAPTPLAKVRNASLYALLFFAGLRREELRQLTWEHVDFERGLLFLPNSKSGKRTVVLNGPALSVLQALPRLGTYVIAGRDPNRPRADLNKPWAALKRQAGLAELRLHDLRHSFASFGAGAGLGLPVIGKLLGHAKAATTDRYAHLDADPLRRASEQIASTIAAALGPASEPSLKVVEAAGDPVAA